jgi:hypothetical protein
MRISQKQLSTLELRFLQPTNGATSWTEYSQDDTYAGCAAAENLSCGT